MDKKHYITSLLFLVFICGFAQTYNIVVDDSIGCGQLSGQFSVSDTTGVNSALWDFGNGQTFSGITPPIIDYDTSGVFIVSLNINNTIRDTMQIAVYPIPPARFSSNDSVLLGSYNVLFEIEQDSSGFDTVKYNFNWDFGDNITYTSDTLFHGHRYSNSGTYLVNVTSTDFHGCSNSTSQSIELTNNFKVPNVFTPNGDGINDILAVSTNGYSIYSFLVFSRTGTMVYKTEGPIITWDGYNNNGVKMSPGIYYYVIKEIRGGTNSDAGFFYMFYGNNTNSTSNINN